LLALTWIWPANAISFEKARVQFENAPSLLARIDLATSLVAQDKGQENLWKQRLATYLAEAVDLSRALREFPAGPSGLKQRPSMPSALVCQPAGEEIAQAAREYRFVFINEAHHVPQTRVLTYALLARLRKQGFTHLALEALHESGARLKGRGYPSGASGSYLRESTFAELVREAIRLDYVLVDYESHGGSNAEQREAQQAARLLENTVQRVPTARILVHAGYAHVDRHGGRLFNVPPLAARIEASLGEPVLSIDQVELRSDPMVREHPLYRPLLKRFAPREAMACRLLGKPWALDPGRNDYSLILPDHGALERPAWLSLGLARQRVLAPDLCANAKPCLIEAYAADAAHDELAADRCAQRDRHRCVLYLKPGDYRVSASSADGKILERSLLRVGTP
jgi:hypothetical protein